METLCEDDVRGHMETKPYEEKGITDNLSWWLTWIYKIQERHSVLYAIRMNAQSRPKACRHRCKYTMSEYSVVNGSAVTTEHLLDGNGRVVPIMMMKYFF